MISVIQSGGHSLRMGTDKSLLVFNKRPMIEYVLDSARNVTEKSAIVISRHNPRLSEYEELAQRRQTEILFDLHDHRGPLGGIHTALTNFPDQTIFILACDMPFISAEFLDFLKQIHERENNDVTVPVDAEGRTQMLIGVYSPNCLEPITQMLDADQLKVERVCERVKARRVKFSEYSHLANSHQLLTNINTLNEYQLAQPE